MNKLLLIALLVSICIGCEKNSHPVTTQKKIRLDSFESTRYAPVEKVKNDSLKIAKAF